MRFSSGPAFLLLLVSVIFLAIGCSEKTTGPGDHQMPSQGQHAWSKSFGDASIQEAQAIAVDGSGNVIVTGGFEGIIDFGGGALTSTGGSHDIFVAKFGPDGTHIWSKRFGDWNYQGAQAIAVDASGNVILTGYFPGTVDFGGGELSSAGGYDIFVAKFGSDGTHIWSKRFGDGYSQHAQAVTIDASGDVIVAGYFLGTVDFGGGALTNAGGYNIFVAKFGPDGTHIWSKSFGDGYSQYAQAIAVDASGNMIITGWFDGTFDFGDGALTSAGAHDIFVAKFTSDGTHLWSKCFGDGGVQEARAITVDGSGNVIVTGGFQGTVDFGGGALTSTDANYDDIFVVKFAPDGTHLWSKRFGDGPGQLAHAVAVDGSGNVIMAGYFGGTVDFGGGALTAGGSIDIFVAKFLSNGTHLWSKGFGDVSYQDAYAVAVDASGNVILAGAFQGTVDFGGGALTSAGDYDIFVAKFAP